jgi:hypothetical protein
MILENVQILRIVFEVFFLNQFFRAVDKNLCVSIKASHIFIPKAQQSRG